MLKTTPERRLAAVLMADVVGYTRLMGVDEAGTHACLKTIRREVVDPSVKRHDGRLVKSTGDGVLVEFPSAVEAVACAVEVQRAMRDRNAGVPEDKRIVFRMGLNVGDLIIDEGDIFGDGANVAARLESLCAPGGICISRAVRGQIRDKAPYAFDDLGEQLVKNVARPVRAFQVHLDPLSREPISSPKPMSAGSGWLPWKISGAVVIAAAAVAVAWWSYPRAVLIPNDRTTMAPVAQPAATATTQPMQPAPSRPAPRLSIIVLPFANLNDDPEQEHVADGMTDDVTTDISRISGSFVIARNTAFTYKRKAVDVTEIGRELGVRYALEGSVRRIGDKLRVNARLIDAETGGHLWADRFEGEIAKLSELQADVTGRIARSLDLELTDVEIRRGQNERPENPDENLANVYSNLGANAVFIGRSRESFAHVGNAIRLSPRDPQLHLFYFQRCHAHAHLAEWDSAIEWCRKSVALAPFWIAYVDLISSYGWKGARDEARTAISELHKLMPNYTVQRWAHENWSSNPVFMAEYARIVEGLRKGGLPEE